MVVAALGSAGCGPMWMSQPMFMSSQAGESVLVGASAPAFGILYLRRHSLENGALLASVQIRLFAGHAFQAECEPALPGRLWCLENSSDPLSGGGLRVRDAESLQIVAAQDQILRGTPELAGTPRLSHMRVDPETRGFVFESADGYAWIIDPTTLAPARFARPVRSIPEGPIHPHGSQPAIGDDAYSLEGETRVTLERRAPFARNGTPLHPEHTYLRGKFVTSRNVPIVLDNPPRVLVLEDVVDHEPTLWCLFADGTVQWKLSSVPEALLDAKPYRDTVVLVTSSMLLAVRTEDGAVVWTSGP